MWEPSALGLPVIYLSNTQFTLLSLIQCGVEFAAEYVIPLIFPLLTAHQLNVQQFAKYMLFVKDITRYCLSCIALLCPLICQLNYYLFLQQDRREAWCDCYR
jgi:hypothetical protein